MAYLLFPGRHLLNTVFQERYLWETLPLPIKKMDFLGTPQMTVNDKISEIIFAVTSANQSNSRYNPVPFWARAIGLDRFAHQYKESLGTRYRIIGVPHYPPTDRYVELLLKEIREGTHDQLDLSPQNTIVLCSTPALVEVYQKHGFAVLPAEYNYESKKYSAKPPIEIIRAAFEKGVSLEDNQEFQQNVAKASVELWRDYPDIPATVERIWRDPLLTESGGLTQERNYSTYALEMGHSTLLELKYRDIKEAIVPGKIVDEGCADGALMVLLAIDFPDSDIIGIEITSEFMARCLERQRAGEFGGTFVHFHQRNLLDPIFEDNSIDSAICNSTTHEIWSYGNGAESLRGYFEKKFKQLRPGGRLIVRDVVGPENKAQEVRLRASRDDGLNDDVFKDLSATTELADHLKRFSTYARFKRFAEDFLADMRKSGRRGEETKIRYWEEVLDGIPYFVLRLKDAVEFMTRKDYLDNWHSELNEEFAFMSFSEWKKFAVAVGFRIIENPNEPAKSSRVYANPWIIENRFKGKTDLFVKNGDKLDPLDYPVTNMVLICEKPVRG
ncbi:MAG: Methyltransferase type 12 [Parcubacteria group bacterium GW2011_GWB1_52_7]|nr:MAG: Methyltransferase type 12 [Parcubacteria group bacterium GW2011_GWB1_52_7]